MDPEFAARYGSLEEWHWWFRGRRKVLETVLTRELDPGPARRIATVGCGPAEGLRWLIPYAGPGGFVVGVDSDPGYAWKAGPGIGYVVGSLETTPLVSSSFDAVLALDVLEHLDDDAKGLAEAARLLKAGGLLVATVPAMPSLWGAQDLISRHRRRYTARALSSAFQRAGLRPPSLFYFNSLLFLPIAAVRWTRRLFGPPDPTRSDFEGARPGPVNDLLAAIFATERHLVGRVPMPLGVSLLATARAPGPGI